MLLKASDYNDDDDDASMELISKYNANYSVRSKYYQENASFELNFILVMIFKE